MYSRRGHRRQKWRLRNERWMPMATSTHSVYVMLYAFPLQQWLHESSIVVGFSPGEVKISTRIKVPPPLPRSREFLPSGGRFEIEQCCQQCWGKNFPLRSENFPPCGKKLRSCCGSFEQEWSMSQWMWECNKWIIIIFQMIGFRLEKKQQPTSSGWLLPRAVW